MTAKTPTPSASLSDAARGVACWLGQGARLGLDLLVPFSCPPRHAPVRAARSRRRAGPRSRSEA